MAVVLCSVADVLDALGGIKVAIQLFPNPSGDGTDYDATRLLKAMEDGEADVADALGDHYAQYSAGSVIPGRLRRLAKEQSVVYCWRRSTSGLATPSTVKEMGIANSFELQRLEKTETIPQGAVNILPTTGDNSDGGRRATWATFRRSGPNGAR